MMKNLNILCLVTSIIGFAFAPASIFAKKVDVEKATAVARFLMEQQFDAEKIRGEELTLIYTAHHFENAESLVLYYVYNVGEQGFIIISGDDIARPVLGYSTEGNYNPDNLPPNFVSWMEEVSNGISTAVKSRMLKDRIIESEWDAYLNKDVDYFSKTRSENAVNPLIQTKWHQNAPYWNLCPVYNSQNCYAGCVATAMSQIMKYYNLPASGSGTSTAYTTTTLKISVPSVNLNVNYNFNNMGGTAPSTSEQINNVAKLMYHCGVTVEMDYTPSGSGAFSQNVTAAIATHFGYDKAMLFHDRRYYSDAQWIDMMKKELNANRPIYHAGSNADGGHAFICDGFNDLNQFHFNWGWAGSMDAYFSINAIPSHLYPNLHQIFTGWKPNAGGGKVYQIDLIFEEPGKNLTATKSAVNPLEAFTASARFYNGGGWDFPGGEYGIGLFNASGNLVSVIGSLTNNNVLKTRYYFTNPFTIDCKVPASVPAGFYTIKAITKANGATNWVVARGTNIFELPLQVKGSGGGDCAGVTNMKVDYTGDCEAQISWTPPASSPTKGVVFSENFEGSTAGWTIQNNSNGKDWGLYESSADYPAHSGSIFIANLLLEGKKRDAWIFSPGISLTAGTKYTIKFWLRLPGRPAVNEHDYFELKIGNTNSSSAMMTSLYNNTTTYIPNWTLITTDFTPTTSGKYYLGFHAFTPVSEGWVISVDDIEVSSVTPSVPCNIYRDGVKIASNVTTTPYMDRGFNINTGHTWEVKVACTGGGESAPAGITKSNCIVGVEDNEVSNIQIVPNPTTGEFTITNYELQITNVEVYDILGKKHESLNAQRHEGGWSLDISNLSNGIYFLRISTETGVVTKKIIKQ